MMDRRTFLMAAPATLTLPTLAQSDDLVPDRIPDELFQVISNDTRPTIRLMHSVLKRSVLDGTTLQGFQFQCDENGELMEHTVGAYAVGKDNIPHYSRPFVNSEWVKRKNSFVGEV